MNEQRVGASYKSVKPFKKKEETIFGHICRGRFMALGCSERLSLPESGSIFWRPQRGVTRFGLLVIVPDGQLSERHTISGCQLSSGSILLGFFGLKGRFCGIDSSWHLPGRRK
jgi:hypothetical protein